MTISAKTTKMLWGRAAARCSNCRKRLYLDETEVDDPALIGEMAHMVAESVDGPRGASPLTSDERDLYENLLLLCRNHHREIDAQPNGWPIDRLQKIKTEHEAWVEASLPDFDAARQRDDETYLSYIEEWARRACLDDWTAWTSAIFAFGQPSLDLPMYERLQKLGPWIMKRVWPARYPQFETALKNFALVLNDFLKVFGRHANTPQGDDEELWTEKFYKIKEWDEERYHQLLSDYEHHVDLVEDLALELTRAANLVADRVRESILSSYRLKEGRLSVKSGPYADLTIRESIVQYDTEERDLTPPYPGLDIFLSVRARRDMYFGSGE